MQNKRQSGRDHADTVSGGPIVLFDGICILCNAGVDFLLRRDRKGIIRFAAMQSDAGRRLGAAYGLVTENPDSFYVIDGDRVFERSQATLHLVRYLGWPWRLALAFALVPRSLRDHAYNVLARNRYRWFGQRQTCRLPTPGERNRFLDN